MLVFYCQLMQKLLSTLKYPHFALPLAFAEFTCVYFDGLHLLFDDFGVAGSFPRNVALGQQVKFKYLAVLYQPGGIFGEGYVLAFSQFFFVDSAVRCQLNRFDYVLARLTATLHLLLRA